MLTAQPTSCSRFRLLPRNSPPRSPTCDTLTRNSTLPYLDSEESVNRRLLLASALTWIVFVLANLLLVAAPSEQKSQTANKTSVSSKASSAPKSAGLSDIPMAAVSVNGVNDIDPTKAIGSRSAPVTMEVFSDFQCPACKQLFTTTTQRVMSDYVNTGKIYLVHRDFPLPMHAYSRVAASYSRASAHIGKDEVVAVALFQNQQKWEADGKVADVVAAVLTPAEMKKVQALVDSKTLEPLIEKDKQLGQVYAINQTPTTWLHTRNGQSFPVVGFVNYDVLKTFLDQLVSQN
jgi:protein-disulfide isomerase